MEYTWILVADRARARIVTKPNAVPSNGRDWEELEALVYPEARIPERAVLTDKPGRTFDRKGSGRHAMTVEISAKEEAAARFAKTLARVLDKGRTNHLYESLILVAEPGFLGTLQANLSAQTAKKVIDRIPKDLTTRPHKELTQDLRALLRPRG
ncbi:host attachment protein [Acidiferrobacter sp.]|jgi:protein required for attachment to host cells|uniref:host attachment protein n=1 Tax=Acidiferrobacter sp. TaxID=1872107 RepID=UPI00260F362A|nr:host attachment protein [Acidiferrobacter sp.]